MPKTTKLKKLQKNTKKMGKKLDKCLKNKCLAITKKKDKGEKAYNKLLKKSCSKIKDDMKYYDCSSKVNSDSGYDKLMEEVHNCKKEKCLKEHQSNVKAMNEEFDYEGIIITSPEENMLKKSGGEGKNVNKEIRNIEKTMKKIKQNIKKNPIFKDKTFKTLVKKMKKCINENCTNVKIFEKEKKIYSNNWKKTCKTKKIYSDFFEKIKDDKKCKKKFDKTSDFPNKDKTQFKCMKKNCNQEMVSFGEGLLEIVRKQVKN